MKVLITLFAALVAVMLLLPTPAVGLVSNPVFQHLMPSTSVTGWQSLLAQETTSTVQTSLKGYRYAYIYGAVDSLAVGGLCTLNVAVQVRWAHFHDKNAATVYYSDWQFAFPGDSFGTPDTMLEAPLFGCDSIGGENGIWPHYNLQVRAYGANGNDSSKVRLWCLKYAP